MTILAKTFLAMIHSIQVTLLIMTLFIALINAILPKCFIYCYKKSHLKAKSVISKAVIIEVFVSFVIVPKK